MVHPAQPDFSEPSYVLVVAGKELGTDVTRFIERVEYEHADGIAEMAKLTVANPDGLFTDSKLFQPGNEMDIYAGYGAMSHLGRVQLVRPQFRFPKAEPPTLEVTGFTRDHSMMDHTPKGKGKPPRRKGQRRVAGSSLPPGTRVFKEATIKAIVAAKAASYKFDIDAPDDYAFPDARGVVQKARMSDYAFLRGLANFLGWYFWVDYQIESFSWVLHFRKPNDISGLLPFSQEKKFTFVYNQGDRSTLLSFDPELAIREARTNLFVECRNPDKGKTFSVEVVDEGDLADVQSDGNPNAEIEDSPGSAADIKLFFGEFSFEVVANKRFKSDQAVKDWAKQWFRRNRENFVMGRGELIGIETLRARQVHAISGVGRMFDGDYFFSRVRHILSAQDGYSIDFHARKVLGV